MDTRIVVGVDGSDSSVAALRWAVEEARLRDAALEVVHAWEYPGVADVAAIAAYTISPAELERGAREVLDAAIAAVGPMPTGVVVTPVVVHGSVASALVDASKGAEMLVVGTRGRGGFAGLLLGSVSQQCVHHARCPVVVIRPTD